MKEILYMVTTTDRFELPLCVGNVYQVAEFLGIKPCSVYQYVTPSRGNRCRNKRYKIIKVEVDDEELS